MSSIRVDMTMSLDGYVTGPDDGPDAPMGTGGFRLFDFIARHAPQGTDVTGWRGQEQPPQLLLTRGRQIVDEGFDAILPSDDGSTALTAKSSPAEGVSAQVSRSTVADR